MSVRSPSCIVLPSLHPTSVARWFRLPWRMASSGWLAAPMAYDCSQVLPAKIPLVFALFPGRGEASQRFHALLYRPLHPPVHRVLPRSLAPFGCSPLPLLHQTGATSQRPWKVPMALLSSPVVSARASASCPCKVLLPARHSSSPSVGCCLGWMMVSKFPASSVLCCDDMVRDVVRGSQKLVVRSNASCVASPGGAPASKVTKHLLKFPHAFKMFDEMSQSQRHIVCTAFVGNDFSPSATIGYKICPPRRNLQSIMTGFSVSEEEVSRAFKLFLSTEKDETVSTKEMCSFYIERLCRLGKLSDAVCLLRLLHDRKIHLGLNIYNILLSAAGDANNFDFFSEIFKNLLLSSLPPDFTSYVNVAKAFQKVADLGLVLKFVREVSEITIHRDPTVINRMIFITAKSGQINKSMMIFEDLKKLNCKMDKVTFNTVLGILGKAGQVDQMLSVFTSMKDCGHTPDIVTYNTVVNCLRRLGRLELCRIFSKEMVENGIQLDLQTYTALIDGFGRAGHAEDALNIFHEMKKSLHPSIYIYRALINNLKKAGKFECALNLYAEMNSSISKIVGPEDFKRKRQTKRYIKQVETGERILIL